MILYQHDYNGNSNTITVRSVEVKETDKQYRVADMREHLLAFNKVISKDILDVCINSFFDYYYMASKEIKADYFKRKIKESLNEDIKNMQWQIDYKLKRIDMINSATVTMEDKS